MNCNAKRGRVTLSSPMQASLSAGSRVTMTCRRRAGSASSRGDLRRWAMASRQPSEQSSRPPTRVVCVAGDGGIAYALGELATCRKYDLAIVVVVLNNGCLAYSKWGEYKGEGHYENVDFPDTNFALIARAFGCVGLRVEAPDELSDALAQALQSDAPTLIDVVVDPWATPELRLRRERRPVASTA